jgi:aryl-alcohol dehydrogenase-like predicted oxidoreductase
MMLGTRLSEAESFAILDRAFELGLTALDTAHIYGGGECERVVGRWSRARGVRDQLVLIGKGAHPRGEQRRVTPADIAADLSESLERLQTDFIDLYLLHRDDPDVPVGTIVEALSEHQRASRIGAYGGSNWTAARLQAASDYAAAHGRAPMAASSPHFSLAEQVAPPWPGTVTLTGPAQAAERALYAQTQLPVFAWSSLANGFFSGRYRPDRLDTYTTDADRLCLRAYGSEQNFQRLARATELGQSRGLSAAQVALAYALHQPLNLFALVGAYSVAEVEANAAAVGIELSEHDLAWLETGQPGRMET